MTTLLDNSGLTSEGWKSYLPESWTKSGPIVPVLRFTGAIGVVTPLRPGLSLATSAAAIEKAFTMRGAKAVAIQINSPGGSAVQSMLIYKRVRALAAEKNLKVYVFAEDVAASGGYLLALARRRDLCRSEFDRGLDRGHHCDVRLERPHQPHRRRAPRLYRGREQGHARSVSAGEG